MIDLRSDSGQDDRVGIKHLDITSEIKTLVVYIEFLWIAESFLDCRI